MITQQINNCVLYPVRKLRNELDDVVGTLKPGYADAQVSNQFVYVCLSDICQDVLLDAEDRFARASRKDAPRKLDELNNDVFLAKQQYHEVRVIYINDIWEREVD